MALLCRLHAATEGPFTSPPQTPVLVYCSQWSYKSDIQALFAIPKLASHLHKSVVILHLWLNMCMRNVFSHRLRSCPPTKTIQFHRNVCKTPGKIKTSVAFRWLTGWHKFSDTYALQIDGLMQERRNPSALAMELRLSCTNPSQSTNPTYVFLLAWVHVYMLVLIRLVYPCACLCARVCVVYVIGYWFWYLWVVFRYRYRCVCVVIVRILPCMPM